MTEQTAIESQIVSTIALMRAKLGVRGKTLSEALRRAKRRLPRRIYKQATLLANVEPLTIHPKLRLTLDTPALNRAAQEVQHHLNEIDVADRRKGWWLGMLGGLVFNFLLLLVLLLVVFRWRGLI